MNISYNDFIGLLNTKKYKEINHKEIYIKNILLIIK